MASVHISSSIFILQVVKEEVFLRVFSHDPEESRLGLHPVKLFDEGVVLEALDELNQGGSEVEEAYLLGYRGSYPLRVDRVPLDSDALHLIAMDVVVA
jgi:hypothetical protein